MYALLQTGLVLCDHSGVVSLQASQSWVSVDTVPVLVATDPQGKSIGGCPNVGATIKPCTTTLAVTDGYCDWVSVDGKAVCLDTVTGKTDGTAPGTVSYTVKDPGQHWVDIA